MYNHWKVKELSDEEKKIASLLAQKYKLLTSITSLMVQRGVRSVDEAEHFLEPRLSELHDPFLMKDMDAAVRRINQAIGNKERILIYGDYDVDGTTAVALVYKYLRQITPLLEFYIPDRYTEGSGISDKALDFAKESGCTLLITLDCGTKEVLMIEKAAELGIDVIVCDHHLPGRERPNCVALLNPKAPDSGYPFKELSGCGVGFKLMQAFAMSNRSDKRGLYDLVDLVAVSCAADLVELRDENRILAYYGLKKLNRHPTMGLKGLINVSGISNQTLDISDIIFKIGPRINASGRIQNGRESVELLLSKNPKDALKRSVNLDKYNTQRREIDQSITQEANEIVEGFKDMDQHKVIVVYDPSWHSGVIGIVASRLSEKYNRPTIVLSDSDSQTISGSARSVRGFNIYSLIERCSDLLENFGGHPFASGLTIKKKNFHRFIKEVTEIADREISLDDLTPVLHIEEELKLREITPKFRRQLLKLAPFGHGNEPPIFVTYGVVCVTPPRITGYQGSHLKLVLSMPDQMPIMQAMAYNQADKLAMLQQDTSFDVAYTIDEFTRQGHHNIQLNIKDIRLHTADL